MKSPLHNTEMNEPDCFREANPGPVALAYDVDLTLVSRRLAMLSKSALRKLRECPRAAVGAII